jgi:hypothetical protein
LIFGVRLPTTLFYHPFFSRSVCDARHAINGEALNSFRVSFLAKELSNFSSFPFRESTFLDAVALGIRHFRMMTIWLKKEVDVY